MRKNLLWISVILWMILIFQLSSQTAVQSGKLSREVTNINMRAIEKVKPNTKINILKFHHIIRKNAHFFIYLGLGVLTITALKRSGLSEEKSIVVALLICMLYALSDEIHQIFVSGRSAEIKDALIDSIGAAVGILMYEAGVCLAKGSNVTKKVTKDQ